MSGQFSFWTALLLGFSGALALWPWLNRTLSADLRTRAAILPLSAAMLVGVARLLGEAPTAALPFVSLLPLAAITELIRVRCPVGGQMGNAWKTGIGSLLALTLCVPILDPRRAYLLAGLIAPFTGMTLTIWLARRGMLSQLAGRLALTSVVLAMIGILLILAGSRLGPDISPAFVLGLVAIVLAALPMFLALVFEPTCETREPDAEPSGDSTDANAQQQLFISISHDMRTPLSGIMGMAELLLESPLTPVQREYVQTIQSSGNALLHVLNDRLDLSHQQERNLTILDEVFDLAELLNYCLGLFKTQAEDKQVELIGYLDAALPRQVLGDVVHLRQILSRLVHNGLRFTDRGEVVVSIRSALRDQELALQFTVQDTGPGIGTDQLPLVFQESAKPVAQTSWHTGPDLATCKRLVEAMSGEMTVSSRPGEGSAFTFLIPLRSASGAQPDNTTEFIALLSDKRLLVVDDNRTLSRVLAEQAGQWGMRVSTAESGIEALAVARNAANLGQPFDVVVMDYQMPGMSGLQLGARIKEDTLINNDVILIMLTGLRQNNIHTLARNAGIHRVVSKPVTSKQLRQVISQEMQRLQGLQQPDNTDDVAVRLGRVKVLIAEDNQLSQKVIRGMMQKLGIESTIVSNGREAVQAVAKDHYDIVLMDCDMPFVDGYTATQEIRNWERQHQRKPIPILALTAHILEEQEQKAFKAGMNEHLSKPIELCDLQNALLRWTQPR